MFWPYSVIRRPTSQTHSNCPVAYSVIATHSIFLPQKFLKRRSMALIWIDYRGLITSPAVLSSRVIICEFVKTVPFCISCNYEW